ncbi:PPE domain-containing protein, partial [Nocardia aurea]
MITPSSSRLSPPPRPSIPPRKRIDSVSMEPSRVRVRLYRQTASTEGTTAMRPIDGRAITNPENAQSFSHAEIKQAADRMDPDGLVGAVDAWTTIAATVTRAAQQFESAAGKAVDQRWEGAAATAAVGGLRRYVARLGEFGEALRQQTIPLEAAGNAAARFKAAIPAVGESSGGSTAPEARNAGEEQARDDMVAYYIQPYGAAAQEIPSLPSVVDPIGGGIGTANGAFGSGSGPNDSSGGAPGDATGTGGTGSPGHSGTSANSGVGGLGATGTGAVGSTENDGTAGTSTGVGTTGTSSDSGQQSGSGAAGTPGDSGGAGVPVGSSGANASGNSSTSGISALMGAPGDSSPAGTSGNSGTNGTPGIPGLAGAPGHSSTTGTSEISGLAGTPGDSGTSGNSGAANAPGNFSTTGTSEISSLAGTPGDSGTSGNSGAANAPGNFSTTGTSEIS